MEAKYHVQLLSQALGDHFGPQALQVIITANLGQDRLGGLIGHPEYHFDDSQFGKSLAYLETQRKIILNTLERLPAGKESNDENARRIHPCRPAWQALGRLTHAIQDFYAHSNYVALWMQAFHTQNGGMMLPDPEAVDPLDPAILNHSELRSGRSYLPLEALTIFPLLVPLVKPFLPHDSHAWMNLDHPRQGPFFPFALSAAARRTKLEYQWIAGQIEQTSGPAWLILFSGR